MMPYRCWLLSSTASPGSDPYWTDTTLLVSADGPNDVEGPFPDESFANHGNGLSGGTGAIDARFNTGTKLYGSASMRFDSSVNDHVRWPDHADWTLGTGDFTIEFYMNFSTSLQLGSNGTLMGHCSLPSDVGWFIQWNGGATPKTWDLQASADGTQAGIVSLCGETFTPTVDQWYYMCVERSGNVFRAYRGTPGGTATMVGKVTNAINIFNSSQPLQISGTSNNEVLCLREVCLDEIRFTKRARYATDGSFPLPGAAWPRS